MTARVLFPSWHWRYNAVSSRSCHPSVKRGTVLCSARTGEKKENGRKRLQRREKVADGGTVPSSLIQNGAVLKRRRLASPAEERKNKRTLMCKSMTASFVVEMQGKGKHSGSHVIHGCRFFCHLLILSRFLFQPSFFQFISAINSLISVFFSIQSCKLILAHPCCLGQIRSRQK